MDEQFASGKEPSKVEGIYRLSLVPKNGGIREKAYKDGGCALEIHLSLHHQHYQILNTVKGSQT